MRRRLNRAALGWSFSSGPQRRKWHLLCLATWPWHFDNHAKETMMGSIRIAWISIAIGLSLLSTASSAGQKQNPTKETIEAPKSGTTDFKVTLLGTGTHGPRPDRFGASTLVEAGPEKLVFDCGRSCTTRLWQLGIPLEPSSSSLRTSTLTIPWEFRICG